MKIMRSTLKGEKLNRNDGKNEYEHDNDQTPTLKSLLVLK
jgi:hypothetical protein